MGVALASVFRVFCIGQYTDLAALQLTADGTEEGAASPSHDTVITLVQKMVDPTLATSSAPPMRRLTLSSMKSLCYSCELQQWHAEGECCIIVMQKCKRHKSMNIRRS